MVVALAVWSMVIEPGKKITHEVFRDIVITNAALGAKLEDEKARSTLKIFYTPPPTSDDEEDEEEEKEPKKTSPKKAEKETTTLKEVSLCSLIPNTVRGSKNLRDFKAYSCCFRSNRLSLAIYALRRL